MQEKGKILIVDDNSKMRETISMWLAEEGFETLQASNGLVGLEILKREPLDIALTDLVMPVMDGLAFVREARKCAPALSIIVITGNATIQSAITAIKEGAYDYMEKPLYPEKIKHYVTNLMNHKQVIHENEKLREALKGKNRLEGIIYKSAAMVRVVEIMHAVAPSDATVLITGESGTGKDLIANAIHKLSPRAKGPFIAVACAALPSTLLETELFGHEKGAFTGALELRRGRFEIANGGTIFLDEIGDVDEQTQLGLLRAIEEKEITRVGGGSSMRVNVRIVAATNKDLQAMVEEGRFREDLFHRLNVVTITLPPLRHRREEIPLLAEHFLKRYCAQNGKRTRGFTDETFKTLLDYHYPGNIRELEHMIERAVLLSKGEKIEAGDLAVIGINSSTGQDLTNPYIGKNLEEVEKTHILNTLEMVGGNRSKAARILGIDRTTIYNKLKVYGLLE